jgi:hypothetical protein
MSDQFSTSTKALVDDQDAEELEITITWKPGVTSNKLSPFAMERVLLKYLAGHIPTWGEYWMKAGSTLG